MFSKNAITHWVFSSFFFFFICMYSILICVCYNIYTHFFVINFSWPRKNSILLFYKTHYSRNILYSFFWFIKMAIFLFFFWAATTRRRRNTEQKKKLIICKMNDEWKFYISFLHSFFYDFFINFCFFLIFKQIEKSNIKIREILRV